MSNWKDKTDFEINKAVAVCYGYLVQEIDDEKKLGMTSAFHNKYPNVVWVADVDRNTGEQSTPWEQKCFTSVADDAWPIIVENKISIINYDDEWEASIDFEQDTGKFGTSETWTKSISDENALRAAMIVYLEMNGVKP